MVARQAVAARQVDRLVVTAVLQVMAAPLVTRQPVVVTVVLRAVEEVMAARQVDHLAVTVVLQAVAEVTVVLQVVAMAASQAVRAVGVPTPFKQRSRSSVLMNKRRFSGFRNSPAATSRTLCSVIWRPIRMKKSLRI
jgi:hypothetical protein